MSRGLNSVSAASENQAAKDTVIDIDKNGEDDEDEISDYEWYTYSEDEAESVNEIDPLTEIPDYEFYESDDDEDPELALVYGYRTPKLGNQVPIKSRGRSLSSINGLQLSPPETGSLVDIKRHSYRKSVSSRNYLKVQEQDVSKSGSISSFKTAQESEGAHSNSKLAEGQHRLSIREPSPPAQEPGQMEKSPTNANDVKSIRPSIRTSIAGNQPQQQIADMMNVALMNVSQGSLNPLEGISLSDELNENSNDMTSSDKIPKKKSESSGLRRPSTAGPRIIPLNSTSESPPSSPGTPVQMRKLSVNSSDTPFDSLVSSIVDENFGTSKSATPAKNSQSDPSNPKEIVRRKTLDALAAAQVPQSASPSAIRNRALTSGKIDSSSQKLKSLPAVEGSTNDIDTPMQASKTGMRTDSFSPPASNSGNSRRPSIQSSSGASPLLASPNRRASNAGEMRLPNAPPKLSVEPPPSYEQTASRPLEATILLPTPERKGRKVIPNVASVEDGFNSMVKSPTIPVDITTQQYIDHQSAGTKPNFLQQNRRQIVKNNPNERGKKKGLKQLALERGAMPQVQSPYPGAPNEYQSNAESDRLMTAEQAGFSAIDPEKEKRRASRVSKYDYEKQKLLKRQAERKKKLPKAMYDPKVRAQLLKVKVGPVSMSLDTILTDRHCLVLPSQVLIFDFDFEHHLHVS